MAVYRLLGHAGFARANLLQFMSGAWSMDRVL